jgi:hypothetical protein
MKKNVEVSLSDDEIKKYVDEVVEEISKVEEPASEK